MQNTLHDLSSVVKHRILETGASYCGFSKPGELKKEHDFLIKWLQKGYHAGKTYLEKNTETRANPELLVKNARSVISVLFNYYSTEENTDVDNYRISKYALGTDYHLVLNEKLEPVIEFIKEKTGSHNTLLFVDTAPLFEKAWASRSGLGWIGKNTLLVNKESGSFHFIATIITDIELVYDTPAEDNCGNCTLCLEACPTKALVKPYELDVNKCISHLTIEQKDKISNEFQKKFHNYIFGCDICQDACPWNKKTTSSFIKEFHPNPELVSKDKEAWKKLTEDDYLKISKDSAISRIKFMGLKRNIEFLNSD